MGTVIITNDDASVGGNLSVGGMIQSTARQSVTLLNGWVVYSVGVGTTPAYYRDSSGFVHLEGKVNGVGASTSTIFTLATGFRPAADIEMFVWDQASIAGNIITVHANGNVNIPQGASGFVLNGISFPTF